MTERKKARQLRGKRIGLALASIHSGSAIQLWPPLLAAAERYGVELFIFPGGRLNAAEPGEARRNRLFDLVSPANVDGVLSWASALGGFIELSELDSFHERWGKLPLVAMSHRVPDRPVVRIDSYTGMTRLLSHFLEIHSVRRFAFLRGPLEHESASDRWRAFIDFHRANNLVLDERLVSSPHPWNEGREALEELLDARALMPGRDFKALISASDLSLYEAVLALRERGFVIPKDLLVAGFNDNLESRILSPAITTVRIPFSQQAGLAFSALSSLLVGDETKADLVLPSDLVIRRSCGCLSPSVRNAASWAPKREVKETEDEKNSDIRHRLRYAVLNAAALHGKVGDDDRSAWLDPLADNFLAALDRVQSAKTDGDRENAAFIFLRTIERIMERLIHMELSLEPWQDVLSALRHEALVCFSEESALAIEDLIGQARVVAAEGLEQAHSYGVWKSGKAAQAVRDLEKDLILVDERTLLSAALMAHLPDLDIDAAYVVEEIGKDHARLIAGFDERGVLRVENHETFARGPLLPRGVAPPSPGRTWIVEPLTTADRYYGYIVLRAGISDGTVYEELRGAITSALQGLHGIDILREAKAAALRAEALKTRFLANVSAEFRSPLKDIIANVEWTLTTAGRQRGANLHAALEAIRSNARQQLRLTDDLLDLSRSEVGELDLEPRLVDPLRVIAHAIEAAGGLASVASETLALPCLTGDESRLVRSLAILIETVVPAELTIYSGARELTIELRRSEAKGDNVDSCQAMEKACLATSAQEGFYVIDDGLEIENETHNPINKNSLRPGLTLAKRLISAHYGHLDELVSKGKRVGWRVNLPYPSFSGGPAQSDEDGLPALFLSTGGTTESVQDLPILKGATVVQDAETLLNSTEGPSPKRALVWAAGLNGGAEALVILALNRKFDFGRRPFLLFPPVPFPELGRFSSPRCAVEALAGKAGTGAILICDLDRNRRDLLMEDLRDGLPYEIIGIGSVQEFCALRQGLNPSLAIVRSGNRSFFHALRDDPDNPSTIVENGIDSAVLLVLGSPLDIEAELDQYLRSPKTILLNEGVLNPSELRVFVRSLAAGRPILPPYTGAIVKNAIRYMNVHLASAISRWKLAEAVNVSEDYLTRVFRKELGMSPWDYLTRLRVHAASLLLRGGSDSVRIIAAKCGFQDQAYFCRVFKKVTGCSPSVFRDSPYQLLPILLKPSNQA